MKRRDAMIRLCARNYFRLISTARAERNFAKQRDFSKNLPIERWKTRSLTMRNPRASPWSSDAFAQSFFRPFFSDSLRALEKRVTSKIATRKPASFIPDDRISAHAIRFRHWGKKKETSPAGDAKSISAAELIFGDEISER